MIFPCCCKQTAYVNSLSLDHRAFHNPDRDKHNQPEKPAEHPKGPGEFDRVGARNRVCAQPNSNRPCPGGQDQAKEVDAYSRVPESSKTVLRHKPPGESSARSYIGSIYLKGLRVLSGAIANGYWHNAKLRNRPTWASTFLVGSEGHCLRTCGLEPRGCYQD